MKNTIAERLEKRKSGSPPIVIYEILCFVMKLLNKRKLGINVKIDNSARNIKGAFIAVSNHASRLDYLYASQAYPGRRLTFVVGYNEFFRGHLKFILQLMRAIPKKNFTPDMNAMRCMRRVIKNGGALALYPEGMSSISGANQPVAVGTGAFIKAMNVPVYCSVISGGYLTSTKYNLDTRPGRVDVEVKKLFSPEDIQGMTPEQIEDNINAAIWHDDYEWNKTARVKFRANGRIASQLHTLLWKCPRCMAEFKMLGEADTIKCKACGNGARVNEYYDLIPFDGECVIPETPRAWFDWEREQVNKEILDPNFKLTEHVILGKLPKREYLKGENTSIWVDEGEITLTREGLKYEGASERFEIPIENLPTYGMCTDVSRFYTFVNGEFVEFYPVNYTVEKWFMATEGLHRLAGGKWRDFK